ncbi:hypothetical protein GCM10025760_22240 [Microbacterium yannicii]|uniref:Uncharacterized protein n=1 Tax=Microbacterium yannicii TaxID=671622 RepID=A0ABP9MDQ0_9MICO
MASAANLRPALRCGIRPPLLSILSRRIHLTGAAGPVSSLMQQARAAGTEKFHAEVFSPAPGIIGI